MSSEKLIVLAHGIGISPSTFHRDWEAVIAANQSLTNVTVKGLWWQDVLQKVANQYPIVSGPFAEILAMCGFDELDEWLAKVDTKTFQDYLMDVLVYVGLPDM
jgi:hypothetical protein